MNRRLLTLGLVVGLAGTTIAQEEGQGEPLLGGPPVEIEVDEPTLVERDYAGKLRPLETRAEVAAIRLLDLNDEEREAVDALVLERAKLVDGIVFDNLELLTQLQTARSAMTPGSGQRPSGEQRELLIKMMDMIAPLREQEPLLDHYAEALPEAKRNQYRALVNEWNNAQASEAPVGMGGRAGGRRAMVENASIAGIRTELRSAYERGAAERTERLDDLVARLELTPEQEGEVRRLITDFAQQAAQQNGGEPTQAQRADLFREILGLLEPEQRRKAIESFRS